MCGIAGFQLRGDPTVSATRLLERLASRGPDGSWFHAIGGYGLVQTRLAVIDLSPRVTYPIQNESGDLHLLFNGEIYEHGGHRTLLQRRGHRFATACDAEVLVHGYEEWGVDVFRRLDGMFACALLHVPSGELLLARDALGIKPLAYTTTKRFAFSSDALGLVAAGLASGAIDPGAAAEYLTQHYLAPPRTALRDVRQLQPGELLCRTRDGATTRSRWRARPFSAPPGAEPVSARDLELALDRSVAGQLVADVPVGVFLSSGIDSALVLDSAVRAGARPTAFTIGFGSHGDYDEVPSAARLTRELGVEHVVEELAGGFGQTLALVSRGLDQPLGDASAIATAQLAALARHHVTVSLSGTGGDDLFAGYYRHRAHRIAGLLGRIPAPALRAMARLPRERGAERRSLLTLASSYTSRLASLRSEDAFAQYLELVETGTAAGLSGELSLHGDPRPRHGASLPTDVNGGSVLRRIQAFELATYLPGDLLAKEDRTTMAAGLEARVPLLARDMLELAERAEDGQKAGVLSGKRLLRELARRRLPAYIARARKRGFAVPLAHLFTGPWREEARDWFGGASSALIDTSRAGELLAANALPATDAWAVAILVEWERSVAEAAREASRDRASGTSRLHPAHPLRGRSA